MAENGLGSPGPGAGGISGASMGAQFKVDDSSLKSLHATWQTLIKDVKAFSSELKQIPGGGLGGGGGANPFKSNSIDSGRMPGMPALPSGFNSHMGTGGTGGAGGTGGSGGGGGGGSSGRGGLGGSGITSAAITAGIVAGLGKLMSGSNLDQMIAGSQINRNAAFGGGTERGNEKYLFGGGSGSLGGFGTFAQTQGVVNTLSQVGTGFGPGVVGSPQGRGALGATKQVSNLTGDPAGAANVAAQMASPQTFYKMKAYGIDMSKMSSDPQGFAESVLKRLYNGRLPTQAELDKGAQPGQALSYDLTTGLGLNQDTANFILEYGYAQSKATAAGKGNISLAPSGPGGRPAQTPANRAGGVGVNAASAYQASQSVKAGNIQALGASSPLAGYFSGIAQAGQYLTGALQSFVGTIVGTAGLGASAGGGILGALGLGSLGGLLTGGGGGAGSGAGAGGAGGGGGGGGIGGSAIQLLGLRALLSGGGGAGAGAAGGAGLLGGAAGLLSKLAPIAAVLGVAKQGMSFSDVGSDLSKGHFGAAERQMINSPVGKMVTMGAGTSLSDLTKGHYKQALNDIPGAGIAKGVWHMFGGGSATSSGAAMASASLLRSSSKRGGSGGAARLKIVRPVPFPVSQAFGHDGHPGTDYSIGPAGCGANILAAEDGVVIEAGPAQGFGNWIVIQHPDGYYTVYGHMYDNGVLVRSGQKVTAGQVIGKVGSNGDSTGCHLHLEVHQGWPGTRLNPESWLVSHGAVAASGAASSTSSGTSTASTPAVSASSAPAAVNASSGNYGSVEERDSLAGALAGGLMSAAAAGSSSSSNTTTSGSATNQTTGSTGASTNAPNAPSSPSGNVKIAQTMAAARGWTGAEWNALYQLWQHESGFNAGIANMQGSGAYGIPQALPANKMASAGPDWATNPATQIKWGLGYIASVYGDPIKAWAKWQSRSPNWYREGTINAQEGPANLHGGEIVINAAQSDQLRATIKSKQAQPPLIMGATGRGGSGKNRDINISISAPLTVVGGQQDAQAFLNQIVRLMEGDARIQALVNDLAGVSS